MGSLELMRARRTADRPELSGDVDGALDHGHGGLSS